MAVAEAGRVAELGVLLTGLVPGVGASGAVRPAGELLAPVSVVLGSQSGRSGTGRLGDGLAAMTVPTAPPPKVS
jgi:hypothetical protein